jgi:micrococcal nuclease
MKKRNVYLLIFLFILLLNTILYPDKNKNKKLITNRPSPTINYQLPITITASSSATLALVKRVIDGDTIELESGQKVRYIGVDTPELHHPQKAVQCFGEEAKNINQKLVEGKTIKLEKDISETDRYGRLLRYVFLPDSNNASGSGIFINQYLIEEGYAYAATFPPDVKYAELFRQKQQATRINNKGLWKACQN